MLASAIRRVDCDGSPAAHVARVAPFEARPVRTRAGGAAAVDVRVVIGLLRRLVVCRIPADICPKPVRMASPAMTSDRTLSEVNAEYADRRTEA
jgi:hypothetical protein